tara:strand:+ start:289 stop:618 length:330 start_codon:yes stop_codon:yes gene_type:complete
MEKWDGLGANPITTIAIEEASRLLMEFPSSYPLPDIVPEPGGDIALEWYKDKNNVFVISFSGNNVISYAGLFGENNKTYGTEFVKDSIPESILDNINRIFSEAGNWWVN